MITSILLSTGSIHAVSRLPVVNGEGPVMLVKELGQGKTCKRALGWGPWRMGTLLRCVAADAAHYEIWEYC